MHSHLYNASHTLMIKEKDLKILKRKNTLLGTFTEHKVSDENRVAQGKGKKTEQMITFSFLLTLQQYLYNIARLSGPKSSKNLQLKLKSLRHDTTTVKTF